MTALMARLIWKELYELARQPWVLLGAFLVPLYLLYVATTFVNEDAPTRMLIHVPPGQDDRMILPVLEQLFAIDGIVPIFITDEATAAGLKWSWLDRVDETAPPLASIVPKPQNINALMAQHDTNLAIVLSIEQGNTFVERSETRFQRRVNYQLASRIGRELEGEETRFAAALVSLSEGGGAGIDLRHLTIMNGPASQLFIPRFLALITVLVATVLSTRSMLRDLESRTLPLLITLPRSGWFRVVLAKLIFVLALSTTVLAFLVLTLQPMFGFYLRPGVAEIFGVHLLAGLASACVGFGLALLGRSTVQAYLAVTVYLIANLVLTGFVDSMTDLPAGSETALRMLFPLTYLRPIYEGWLFFGEPVSWHTSELLALGLNGAGSLVLLAGVMKLRQRQF